MNSFFEFESGKACKATAHSSCHYADGYIHVWHGNLMYSFYSDKNTPKIAAIIKNKKFNDYGEGLEVFENSFGEFSFYMDIDRDTDGYNQVTLVFDSGVSRMMIALPEKHLSNLADFLIEAFNEEQNEQNLLR